MGTTESFGKSHKSLKELGKKIDEFSRKFGERRVEIDFHQKSAAIMSKSEPADV